MKVANLGALRELCAWMREERVLYARCGELELRLEAVPAPPVPAADLPDGDEDDERRSLETLLHSSGVEAEPFLRAIRGRKSA